MFRLLRYLRGEKMAIFTDVFEDVTKQGRKIPTSDYHVMGLHPIIDQGQSEIAGYTDEADGLFTDVPAIVFGDHTRVLKYVNTPCFLGADGVKLLKARIPNPNYKYLYYALSSADIPNTGYNRHFKWLKEVNIPLPDADEQQKIVDALDKVSELIGLRKEQLAKLDQLVKSRFIELFGTIHDNKFGYEINTLQDVCEQIKDGTHQTPTYTDDSVNGYKFLSSKDVTTGKIDWAHLKYIPEELHNELYARIAPRKGDILLAKNGTTGIAAIVDRDEIFDIYVSLALLRPIEMNSVYLWAAINSVETKQQFDSSLKGIGVPNLHLGEIKKAQIIVPPKEEQKRFAAFVEQTDKSKLAIQQSLDKLELLKKSLMQEYFG